MIATQTRIPTEKMTPAEALQLLRDGNSRFINNLKLNRDLLVQVDETKDEQKPYAVILSCMDSRTSVELIFDQGVGDVFSIRIAGNIITDYILGSLEYATAAAGAKLVVVMGHTNCGAVKGACDTVDHNSAPGFLKDLLSKIHPAVKNETSHKDRSSKNLPFVNEVARLNVDNSAKELLEKSDIIRNLVGSGTVAIVPAMYNVSTGVVDFGEPYPTHSA